MATAIIEDAPLTDAEILAYGIPVVNHDWMPHA